MQFTVITPSFNCRPFIATNLASVRNQRLLPSQLEHWVIDGGSTDGTVEFLKQEQGIHWISEPDRGLSDAVNKGIQRASGEWIIWLNADDHLEVDACQRFLACAARHPEDRIFCGALKMLRYDGTLEQIVPGWDYDLEDLLERRTGINQPSTWIHREVYAKVGLLDVNDRYTMDYEWTVRAMHHYRCVPLDEVLSRCRRRKGSITDANMVKQFENFLQIRRRYGRTRFSRAELRIRFYLGTNWLRRIRWFRRGVRRVKAIFGKEPLHPA